MTSPDERREVAARLREAWPEAGGIGEVWEVLDPILGTHDGPDVYRAWEQTFNRIADLIDPTCHAVHSATSMDDELVCSECGAILGVEVDGMQAFMNRFCPCCGARVVWRCE